MFTPSLVAEYINYAADVAEWLVSQNVIPHRKHFGGTRPYAFTEQGVAMLSSVLNSKRAVEVNIMVVRTFVKLRKMIATHKDLTRKLSELEKKYDGQFKVVFNALRQLMAEPQPKEKKIGFIKEPQAIYRTTKRIKK